MAEEDYIKCNCLGTTERNGWSYSTDDLFCPGCGMKIASLVSERQYPRNSGSGELWVYPKSGGDQPRFEASLLLEYADAERIIRRRTPRLDLKQAYGESRYFDSEVELIPPESGDNKEPITLRLQPRPNDDGNYSLPDDGVTFRLQGIFGDFSEKELVFLIGDRPSIRIELTGPDIGTVSGSEDEGPVVTKGGELSVLLQISAVDAPVILDQSISQREISCKVIRNDSTLPDEIQDRLTLRETVAAGTRLVPSEPPLRREATLNTGDLLEGDIITIRVPVFAHGARISRSDWSFSLTRVDKGKLEFDPLNQLMQPVMFIGEFRSNAVNDLTENPEGPKARDGEPPVIRRVYVTNRGKDTITLGIPRRDESAEWLKVRWSKDVIEGSKRPQNERVILAPEERAEIYIGIDLRQMRLQDIPDGSLKTDLTFTNLDTDELHNYTVVVNEVRERTECPKPLCVDFGNTSSFAAIANPYAGSRNEFAPWLAGEVLAVHDQCEPERFATALFFNVVSETVSESEYTIGPQAVDAAQQNDHGALVTDLKRWIGDSEREKPVFTPYGKHSSYTVRSLMILYLWRILQRAEAILREFTITEICVSHPSKFHLDRREEFFDIIDEFCRFVTEQRGIPLRQKFADAANDPPRKEIQTDNEPSDSSPAVRVRRGVDEANAVAVGAVFDDDIRQHLRRIVSKERQYFTVASFDLGGGSLDTALIRFNVRRGRMINPVYQTDYLGIGGHDGFGGDHITYTVCDILRDRIFSELEKAGLNAKQCLKCIPDPHLKDFSDVRRSRNYEVLWTLAEEVKIFQSSGDPSDHAKQKLQILGSQFSSDLVLSPDPAGTPTVNEQVQDVLRQWAEADGFLVPLEEIYSHSMTTDLIGETEPWTVRDRIVDCIDELIEFANRQKTTIDLVVRCGKGSRIPLVDEMLAGHDQLKAWNANIVPDASDTQAKFLVAHGLVRFIEEGRRRHTFRRSSDYTSSSFVIGSMNAVRNGEVELIPNCTAVDDPKWHWPRTVPLHSGEEPEDQMLADLGMSADHITVYRVDRGRRPVEHGWFDLTRQPDIAEGGRNAPLNDDLIDELDPLATVRVNGSENVLEMKVETESEVLGIWRMRSDKLP